MQRRNKFICMLMVALQEIGIEGPRMNLQGAAVDIPFHVSYNGLSSGSAAPSGGNGGGGGANEFAPISTVYGGGGGVDPIPEEGETLATVTSPAAGGSRHPSILRKGMHVAAARARGDSTASRRHVDFSLGMDSVTTADVMGDVFESRNNEARADDVVLAANREAEERRRQRQEEKEKVRQNEEQEEEKSRTSQSRADNDNQSRRSAQSNRSRRSGRFLRSFTFNHGRDIEQGDAQGSSNA